LKKELPIEISPHAQEQMIERGANKPEVLLAIQKGEIEPAQKGRRRCKMKISYDPSVDTLDIRFVEGQVECEVIQLNERVSINIGPQEQVVGIEVLDASEVLSGLKERRVQLENLIVA